jgi:hypothetical protein
MTCEVGNPVPGLGQVLKCGGVKLINGILCSIRHFEMSKRTDDIELKKYFTRNALYVDINVVSIQ